jgi:hypothetical protein
MEPNMMRPILLLAALSLCLSLAACGGADTASVSVTELQAGSQQSSVDVTIAGDLSPDQGRYLTFQVLNTSQMPVILSADKDLAHGLTLAPGESGALHKKLDPWARSYHFGVNPPAEGGTVSVTYTLLQSTVAGE